MYSKSYSAYKKAPKKMDYKLTPAQKKEVKRIIAADIETKVYNGGYGLDSAVSSSGTVYSLANIPAGAGQGQRVGREVKVKRMDISFEIFPSSGGLFLSPDTYNTVRIILFRWKVDTAMATPVLGNILDTASSAVAYPTQFPYNYDGRKNYHIIWDKVFQISNFPVYDGTNVVREFVKTIHVKKSFYGRKLGSTTINWDSTNVFPDDNIYALYISDSAATPDPQVTWVSQVFYEDA
jgi:hypothetical protein